MKKFISFILTVMLSISLFAEVSETSCYPVGKDIKTILVSAPVKISVFKSNYTGFRIIGDPESLKYINYTVCEGKLIIKTTSENYLIDKDFQVLITTPNSLEIKPKTRLYKISKTKNGNHGKK